MGLKEIKRQFVIGLTLSIGTKPLLRSERQQEAISLNLLRRSIMPSPPASGKVYRFSFNGLPELVIRLTITSPDCNSLTMVQPALR